MKILHIKYKKNKPIVMNHIL